MSTTSVYNYDLLTHNKNYCVLASDVYINFKNNTAVFKVNTPMFIENINDLILLRTAMLEKESGIIYTYNIVKPYAFKINASKTNALPEYTFYCDLINDENKLNKFKLLLM